MNFGFSWIGPVFLALLLVPNLIWTRHKPAGYDQAAAGENKVLLALERIGEVLVTALSLVRPGGQSGPLSPWGFWLAGAAALMVLYEVFWVRYFRGPKTMEAFYSSLLGVPVAGATLPVAAFFLLAVYEKHPLLGLAAILLGAGHIGIHLGHRRQVQPAEESKEGL